MAEKDTGPGEAHRAGFSQLVIFAWLVECVGVGCGVVNSAYTTFGADFPNTLLGWLPAIPLAALAATELLRVPFAQAIATHRNLRPRLIATLGLMALTGLALENWVFGFERIVSIRLAAVSEAISARETAKAENEAMSAHASKSAAADKAQRVEIERRLQDRREHVKSLAEARTTADQSHQANLASIRQTCLRTAKNDNCARDRSRDEDQRYKDEIAGISRQQDEARQEIIRIQSQLDQLTLTAKGVEDENLRAVQLNAKAVDAADARVREAMEGNQIYRLASMWFRVPPEQLSEAQFAQARGFFCVFGALIISIVGSLAAYLGTVSSVSDATSRRDPSRIYLALRVLVRRRRVRIAEKLVPMVKYLDRIVYKHVAVDPLTGNVVPTEDRHSSDKSPILKVA